jgi:hypothetical protein
MLDRRHTALGCQWPLTVLPGALPSSGRTRAWCASHVHDCPVRGVRRSATCSRSTPARVLLCDIQLQRYQLQLFSYSCCANAAVATAAVAQQPVRQHSCS